MVTRARNRDDASPDLFNSPAMDEHVRSEAPAAAPPVRPLLPCDLEASLQILSEAEFERLLTAVNGEAHAGESQSRRRSDLVVYGRGSPTRLQASPRGKPMRCVRHSRQG
jgi:hypothetical protein